MRIIHFIVSSYLDYCNQKHFLTIFKCSIFSKFYRPTKYIIKTHFIQSYRKYFKLLKTLFSFSCNELNEVFFLPYLSSTMRESNQGVQG